MGSWFGNLLSGYGGQIAMSLGSTGLGVSSAIFTSKARTNASKQTAGVVDHNTGMLNALTEEQRALQEAALAQMRQHAAESQAAFDAQAAQRAQLTASIVGGPLAQGLAPYPKGDLGKTNLGRSELVG